MTFFPFADRMPSFRTSLLFNDCDVAMVNNTRKYRYMKKEMLIAIRQHGIGLKRAESISIKCGTDLLHRFTKQGPKSFDPFYMLRTCTADIMMNHIYGSSTRQDIETIITKEESLAPFFDQASIYMLLDILPGLRFILPSMKKACKDFVCERDAIFQICQKYTEKRRLAHTSQPNCFIDHFLNLQDRPTPDGKFVAIDYDNVLILGLEMLLAGFVSSANALYILLGILANHPGIQDRAYDEIISALGEQTPTMQDKDILPYIEALIWETLRYGAFAALSFPHYTKSGGKLKTYSIPPDTIIFVNIWNLHHDERYWDKPWEFLPQRFLANGSIVPPDHKNKKRVLPFGGGRRQCAGELIARNHIFILATMMLQKFKFLPARGFPKPKHDPREYDSKVNLQIKPYHIGVQVRK